MRGLPVLVCLDNPMPTDGSCVNQAWVEQASLADTIVSLLPTHEEANVIGFAFFGTLFLVAAAVRTFKPQRS